MRLSTPSPIALVAAAVAVGLASAKPEQIRAVQDPIFHLYLQAYPEDREFSFLPSNLPPSYPPISHLLPPLKLLTSFRIQQPRSP